MSNPANIHLVQILADIGKGPVPVSREALQRLMPNQAEEIMQGFGMS